MALFEGYASRFGEVDECGDMTRRGAFKKSLRKKEPRLLLAHRPDIPVGKLLSVVEDDIGLLVTFEMTPPFAGFEEFSGLSIGFRTITAKRIKDGVRELIEVDLWEISLVKYPALRSAQFRPVEIAA